MRVILPRSLPPAPGACTLDVTDWPETPRERHLVATSGIIAEERVWRCTLWTEGKMYLAALRAVLPPSLVELLADLAANPARWVELAREQKPKA